MRPYFVTTPIYYVNDKPHLGTAYCTLMTDTLARYHRLFGEPTYFLTGTDEHGQKVQQAAEKRGVTPRQQADEMVVRFQEAWQALHVSHDRFIRTTEDTHKSVVQTCLQKLWDAGEIYADTYSGWYSVSEEIFYTEKDLVDGKSPTGKAVTKIEEKNYFFRMSKYQQKLIDHIHANPAFLLPDYRANEVLAFLRQPLGDLCISRPKARLSWGIELPFDREYTTYVWFDALLNYATAAGLEQSGREADFAKWWPPVHVIGKDILTTHAVYWTTMLLALGIELPRTIFAHGWILNRDKAKMSKSEGDVVDPVAVADRIGQDELRYFLARDVHFGNDAPFGLELVETRVNADLANKLGNTLNRATHLVASFFDGKKPPMLDDDPDSAALKLRCLELPALVKREVEDMRPSFALEQIMLTLTQLNKYLEDKAPWKMVKTDLAGAGHTLAVALEVLRTTGTLLLPVLPDKGPQLLARIGAPDVDFASLTRWPGIPEGAIITKGDPLFPRLDLKE